MFAEYWTEVRDHLPASFRKAIDRYQQVGKPLYPPNLEMGTMDLVQFVRSATLAKLNDSERVNADALLLDAERTYRYEDLVELRLINKRDPRQTLPQCSSEVARKVRANLLLLRELTDEGAAFGISADQVAEFKKIDFEFGEKLGSIIGRCRTEWLAAKPSARADVEDSLEKELSKLVNDLDSRIKDHLMGDEKELVEEIRMGALMQYFGPLTALNEQPEPLDANTKEELAKRLRPVSQKIQKKAVELEQESIEELIDCFPAQHAALIRERLGERPAWATSYLSRHRRDLVYRTLF